MSHTPGPWEVFEPDDWEFPGIEALASGQTTIVLWGFRGDDGGVRGDNAEQIAANARLIAAAPELLAVCEELRESAEYWSEYDVPLGIVERLNAAIKKARGE